VVLWWQLIEEMYDARYAHDLVEANHEEPAAKASSSSMPVFVYDFFSKKYGLKGLVEQTCWDLVCNLEEYRASYQEVEVFGCFLEEKYDADDLLFFLYIRNVIQVQLEKTRGNLGPNSAKTGGGRGKSQREAVRLTDRMCMGVIRTVFGEDPEMLMDTFLADLDEHLTQIKGQKHRTIDMTVFLALALNEYHETRPQEGEPSQSPPPPRESSLPRQGSEETGGGGESLRPGGHPAGATTKATGEERDLDGEAQLLAMMAARGHRPRVPPRGGANTAPGVDTGGGTGGGGGGGGGREEAPLFGDRRRVQHQHAMLRLDPEARQRDSTRGYSSREGGYDLNSDQQSSRSPTLSPGDRRGPGARQQGGRGSPDSATGGGRRRRGSPEGDQGIFSFSVSPTSTEASQSPLLEAGSPERRGGGGEHPAAMVPREGKRAAGGTSVSPPGGGVASRGAGGGAGLMDLILELRQLLVQDTHDYLSALLGAARGLPEGVVDEIRIEVETRLQAAVARTLSDVIQGAQEGRSPIRGSGEDIKGRVSEVVAEALRAAEEGGTWEGD